MVNKLLIISILIAFTSCSSPFLGVNKMGKADLGDPYSKYEDSEGTFDVDVLADYQIDDMPDGGDYRILLYEQLIFDTNHWLFIPLLINKSEYTYTALAFENNELIFVGYPEDYMRAEEEKINELGKRLPILIANHN